MSESSTLIDPTFTSNVLTDLWRSIVCAFLVALGNTCVKYTFTQTLAESFKLTIWWRFLSAVQVNLPLSALAQGGSLPRPPKAKRDIVAAAGMAIANLSAILCLQAAFTHISLALAQTIINTQLLWTILLAAIFLGERITKFEVFTCILIGLFTALSPEPFTAKLQIDSTTDMSIGILCSAAGAVLLGVSDFLKRVAQSPWHETTSLEIYMNLGLSLLLPFFGYPALLPSCAWSPLIVMLAGVGYSTANVALLKAIQDCVALQTFAATFTTLILFASLGADALFFSDRLTTTWFGYLMQILATLSCVILNISIHRRTKKD